MKLLDEKGLTTVWAAIKNTFTSKSDADGKYAEKSKALGSINFDYTAWGLNMSAYNVDGDGCGYINITSATSKTAGVMTASDKAKLDGIAENANNYSLPLAATSTRGGIQLGYSQNGRNYPVQLSGEKAYVNVPWTDTNTTYDLSSYSQKDETVKNIFNSISGTSTSGYKQILEIDYANGTTKNVEISNASGGLDGFMSASDKNKLDNIAAGANNYTLPVAAKNTLGGIKSTGQEFSGNFGWPIYIIPDGRAFTYIPGLYVNDSNGSIKNIKVNNLNKQTSATYNSEGIIRQTSNGYTTISLPTKGGTLALTSDLENIQLKKGNTTYGDGVIERTVNNFTNIVTLPDDSGRLALDNAIKFNFAGNIENCEDRKINFVFGDGVIKLDSLRNCEDGTIVFFAAGNNCTVTDSQKDWIFNGNSVLSGNAKEIYGRTVCIITVNKGCIIVYQLS